MRIFTGFILATLTFTLLFGQSNAEEKWHIKRSRHFILYYQEGIEYRFLESTIYYAEKYYFEITDRLGFRRYEYWLWDERAKLYIYKDRASYVEGTGMPSWSGGRAIYEKKIIESFPWAKGFFSHLLPHELGHIIFREFVGQKVKVPLWFEEGVASYQETIDYRNKRKDILKEALINSSLVPLEELADIELREISNQDTVSLFYAQSESIIHFLIEKFGQANFVRLCKLIRDFKDFDIAFKKAYTRYESLSDLDKDWQYYLKISFDY